MKRLYSNLFFVAALCGFVGCHMSSLYAMSDERIEYQKNEKPLVKAVRAFCVPFCVKETQNLLNKGGEYVQKVQNLLDKGVDNDEYNEAIKLIISELDAEEIGKTSEFRRQLARIFLVHKERCADATYGLCLSSYLGDEKSAKYFIARGACVNSGNFHKKQSDEDEFAFPVYPLTCAVKSGNISLVEFLVNQGADIHVEQEVVLNVAFWEIMTSGSDCAMFKTLLRLGANLHAKQSYSDCTIGEMFFEHLNDNLSRDRTCNSGINNSMFFSPVHPSSTILKDLAAVLLSHGVKINTH